MCDKGLISGAVSLVQHFDESLSLNIRFHKLFGDQLHSLSAFDEKLKSINTQVKRTATNRKILDLIEDRYGVDFNQYKKTTVNRRMDNRINHLGVKTEENYLLFLEQNPSEVVNLYYEILIGVTQFFRDRESFDILRERVIPRIISEKEEKSEIRVWCSGCASGEEIYSLAILFYHCAQVANKKFDFRFFASKQSPRCRGGLVT